MRTPIHDGNTSIGPKWQRMNIEWLCVVCSVCIVASVFAAFGARTLQLCFCVVASAFAAVGVRTLQLCFCFVASVFADVASVFDAVVFDRSLARSLSPCLFQPQCLFQPFSPCLHKQQPRQ